jgi:uncharacterized protein YdeI (YjbR/CyaY-like superfamily)
MNSKVDFFFDKPSRWQEEYKQLRTLVLDCGLDEELKWGVPCYTFEGSNVVLIHGFKEYCALLFHKGTLLSDSEGILIQQTENVQAARQIRFTTLQDIRELKSVLKSYIYEAIEVEKAGLKVELKKTREYDVPVEFQVKLDESAELESAFKIADRITFLDQGKNLLTASVEEFKNSKDKRIMDLLQRRSRHDKLDPDEYLRRLTQENYTLS